MHLGIADWSVFLMVSFYLMLNTLLEWNLEFTQAWCFWIEKLKCISWEFREFVSTNKYLNPSLSKIKYFSRIPQNTLTYFNYCKLMFYVKKKRRHVYRLMGTDVYYNQCKGDKIELFSYPAEL